MTDAHGRYTGETRDPAEWRKVPKPGGGTGWQRVGPPVGPVSVPLPTPTPEREALRDRIARTMSGLRGRGFDGLVSGDQDYFRSQADGVMPVVDELRAEIEQLRAYAETTRYHQQKHAEACRELDSTRDELATARAAQPGTVTNLGAARKNIKAARQLYVDMAVKAKLLEWGPDAGERDVDRWKRQFRAAWDHDFPELSALVATPPAGSSPVPEEPTATERAAADELSALTQEMGPVYPTGPCGDAFEADWMTRVCVKAAGHESFGDAQYRTHCDGHGTTWTHIDSTVDGLGQPKCFDCGGPVANSEGTTQRRDGQLRTIHIACGRAHILRPAAPSLPEEVQP